MAKATTAFGLIFELKDKASKTLRRLTSGIDSASASMEVATKNANLFGDSLEKTKESRLKKIGIGLSGLGKMAITGAGGANELTAALGNLVGAIPLIGPALKGAGGLIMTLAKNTGDLRTEMLTWDVTLEGSTARLQAMLPELTNAGIAAKRKRIEVLKMARAMGPASENVTQLADRALSLSRAFGVAEEEAAQLSKQTDMSVGEFSKFGGEVLQLQKQFNLGMELMQNTGAIFNDVFESSLRLGRDFKKSLAPSVMGVAKVSGILIDKLKMLPKQAIEVGKTTLKQFKELALNLESVFLGVDEDFDDRTKKLMEMFARSGEGVEAGFEAIQKAADGDFRGIAASFKSVLQEGGDGAKRMRLLLQKSFGPEFSKVLEAIGEDGQEMYSKLFPDQTGKTQADAFTEQQKKMLDSIGNVEAALDQAADRLTTSLIAKMPGFAGAVEGALNDGFAGWNKFMDNVDEFIGKQDAGLTELFNKLYNQTIKPALETFSGNLKSLFADKLGVQLGDAANIFSKAVGMLGSVVGAMENIRDAIRWVASKLGLSMSPDEISAAEADAKHRDLVVKQHSATGPEREAIRRQIDASEIEGMKRKIKDYEAEIARQKRSEEAATAGALAWSGGRARFGGPSPTVVRLEGELKATKIHLDNAITVYTSKIQQEQQAQPAGR